MYEISQLVVYGIHGVCRISDIEQRLVDHKQISYYVLQPLAQTSANFYIPCHNPVATAKMRPLLSKEEIETILITANSDGDWIPDENRRKQHYRQLVTASDPYALVRMVRCLYRQREQLRDTGRKLHLCDENFLRDAEHTLCKEFSLVLQVPEADVPEMLRK